MRPLKPLRLLAPAAASILLWAAFGLAQQAAPPSPPPAAPTPATAGVKPPAAKPAAAKADTSSCITCHRVSDESYLKKPATAWAADVHAAAGLGCESCHGGDPKPRAFADPDEAGEYAMDEAKGFRSPPSRLEMAQFCARCHSDAAYMKRFNPQARVDQLAEYRTSVHGKRNAAGDTKPATCIDCHGSHGIQPVNSPKSPAFAANVPKTCARCHADAAMMAPYKIPTNQYDDYMVSAHANALFEGRDVAAPACNDCHGNHGAQPPEVKSVVHVCGQCHAREATLYAGSFKKELFEDEGVPECIVCHDHHKIRHPTPELFHSDSAPRVSAGKVLGADPFAADFGPLEGGKSVSASWKAVLAPRLRPEDPRYAHRVELEADTLAPIVLDATVRPGLSTPPPVSRAEAAGGLVATLAIEPLGGLPVEAGDALLYRLQVSVGAAGGVRRLKVLDRPGKGVEPLKGSACLRCHDTGDSCDVATEQMYASLKSLDHELRRAATVLRTAELAGMDVSGAQFDLKRTGTTAAVEARALIHTFDAERLVKRTGEGLKAAASARQAGERALGEIQFRRKGLAVSLVLIGLVLVGLYLKIRELDRARRAETAGNPQA